MVGKAKPRRQRNRASPPRTLFVSSGGTPTGPAGGDLAGTYPNPTVNHVLSSVLDGALPALDGNALTLLNAANLTGGAIAVLDGHNLTNLNTANLSLVPLPALDGSALTNLPNPPRLQSDHNIGLDGAGAAVITLPVQAQSMIVSWNDSLGVGVLSCIYSDGFIFNVLSAAGATDAGKSINWIAF